MTDLERIARAIWADRAARILAEDIAGKTEEGSAGKLTYDELGEGFQRGLMSEAKATVAALRDPSPLMMSHGDAVVPVGFLWRREGDNLTGSGVIFCAMCDAILNSENAPASP